MKETLRWDYNFRRFIGDGLEEVVFLRGGQMEFKDRWFRFQSHGWMLSRTGEVKGANKREVFFLKKEHYALP